MSTYGEMADELERREAIQKEKDEAARKRNSLFAQLDVWRTHGWQVEVTAAHQSPGWVCAVHTGSFADDFGSAIDGPRIRACSAVCPTPEAAIQDLLRIIR